MQSLASTSTASTPADCNAECTSWDESDSPAPSRLSWDPGFNTLSDAIVSNMLFQQPEFVREQGKEPGAFSAIRQRASHIFMPLLQNLKNLAGRIEFARCRSPSGVHQLVGDLRQSADHHHRAMGRGPRHQSHKRPMAAASSTEVPPNFITTHSKCRLPCFLARLPTNRSFCLPGLFFVCRSFGTWANKKPTGQLLLAVGLCKPLKLFVSQLTRRPPQKTR